MLVSTPLIDYDGLAFREGEEEQAIPGRLLLTSVGLQFEHAGGTLEWPLSGLTLDQNPDGNLVFYDAETGWWIQSSDRRILNDVFLLRQTHLRTQAHEVRAQQESRRSLKYALYFLFSFAVIFSAAWLGIKGVENFLADHIPPAWEEQLTDSVIAEYPKIFILETNDPRATMVTRLVARIAATLPAGERQYQFRAALIDRSEANAFALPGGRIFVFTGLLNRVQTPEELAGVLAHEMAHVTHRHGLRKLIAAGGPHYALKLFISDQQEMLSTLSAGSQMLVGQYYSRDVEREADTVGWHYLVAADIDPRGLAGFFELLTEGENADYMPSMFRSHPATSERIASLNKLWTDSDRKTGFVDLAAELKKP